jgi:glycosyltransferase involved in cell wall biosynthesis
MIKLVLMGDGESPHLLKWARALRPHAQLWALSSRGFMPGFEALVPAERCLALNTRPRPQGGNAALLRELPRVVKWLLPIGADWLHAHYLTSHGTLAWLARRLGVRARLCGSAWGSDILVTPQRSAAAARLTRRVLRACDLTTSDSMHMAAEMRKLGAGEIMVFPFGLESLPPLPEGKDDTLFFANRGLEPLYAPERVIDLFARIAQHCPSTRFVVANDGSQRPALEVQAAHAGLAGRVRFVGRLDALAQNAWYARARWYVSLPQSDSVAVSVLEAMAHGCLPILSDLPANRELVQHGRNGWICPADGLPDPVDLETLLEHADEIAQHNHAWVGQHALFEKAVERFVARLYAFETRP